MRRLADGSVCSGCQADPVFSLQNLHCKFIAIYDHFGTS